MAMAINTKNYEDVIEKVLIDTREVDRKEYALKQYAPFNPLVTQLDYGDYIFIGYDGTKVIFEYKRGDDFISSIESNRLHNQVFEMTSHDPYCFVIIECEDLMRQLDELYYSTGISMGLPQINGEVADICTVSTVLNVQTQYQAFDLMMRVAGKMIQQKPFSYKFSKKSTNWALNVLSAMKGLDKKAEEIVRTLNLHTLTDVVNLTVEDLLKVDGIGKVKAENIIKNIGERL